MTEFFIDPAYKTGFERLGLDVNRGGVRVWGGEKSYKGKSCLVSKQNRISD